MRIDEINARVAEIRGMLEQPEGLNFEELNEEYRALTAELAEIRRQADAEAELRAAVAPEVVTEIIESKEEKHMSNLTEIRSSNEYGTAYLNMLKTGDDTECRALLSTEVSGGQVPVPAFLEQEIKTAWESNQLMQFVKHSQFKGEVKVGFELTAGNAVVHVEGTAAPSEEIITLGVVTIKNASIKKWITVSDESLDGTTVDTMGYLYKEIAHKIVAAAENILITAITASPATATATAAGVPVLTAGAIAADTIVKAVSMLSGEARDLRIVMNRQTYPAFIAVAMAANYAIDVFDGLKDRIVFSDQLPAFSAAESGATYAIVGDFGLGAQANFPNGNDVTIKVDDLSLAEKDLVKLVGRQYVGIGVVADKAFVKIAVA